ncbi:phosphatidate cytidylyltransferase [Neptuniibacter sp. QD48_11]|uniref:phosphatidate cytidylyltransferase n=1 Tax=unclassified Neptuniibacter TaxID=2630693 RepID=UPI0039F5C559
MLKQRILTALVLAPLALLGVFALPLPSFLYFMDVVILLGAWEWANLSGYESRIQRFMYVGLVASILASLHLFYTSIPIELILSVTLLGWVVALLWVVKYPKSSSWSAGWKRALVGLVVLVPSWIAFVGLKGSENGEMLILLLFLLVWGADVGAYFSGKKFGRVKLAPNVSPGKTREGLYGGLVACAVIALGFALYNGFEMLQVILLVALATVTGLISVLGDLFESMLKRHRGIKDSSQLLPGHGGVLDRIDSLTAASPLFVLGMQYLIAY